MTEEKLTQEQKATVVALKSDHVTNLGSKRHVDEYKLTKVAFPLI